ncbi:unnamed protein product [Boreogadus saida]
MLESHLMGFLVLLSFLPTSSTIGIFNSINDLKKIPFGQSVPTHSLALLHWFANTIELSNNRLELTFEPDHRDYGAHHYGNFQGFLNRLPYGQRYFTLGNINPNINNQRIPLPSYFTDNDLFGYEELNRARIIFTLSSQNTIGQVYITQHYQTNQDQGTVYDPEHTYRITIDLLRELRVFSFDRREQSELSEIRSYFGSSIGNSELHSIINTWYQLACVGLLLFIVINERNLPCRPYRAGIQSSHDRVQEYLAGLPGHWTDNVQARATLQRSVYNPHIYNNYWQPPHYQAHEQYPPVFLLLAFLAVILIIAIAVYYTNYTKYVHKFRY